MNNSNWPILAQGKRFEGTEKRMNGETVRVYTSWAVVDTREINPNRIQHLIDESTIFDVFMSIYETSKRIEIKTVGNRALIKQATFTRPKGVIR